MYRTIANDLISNVLKKANDWALKERSNYKVYAEIIEEYAQTHNLIAGEQTGIDLMLRRPFHINAYPYIFYSKDPEKDGYAIADTLYDQTTYPYIIANSQLDGYEVQVKIADRMMVKIIHLDEYRGVDMLELSDPIVHQGWFNKQISCININVQLARIYRQMSSPAYVDNWESLLKDEEQMIAYINEPTNPTDKLKDQTTPIDETISAKNEVAGSAETQIKKTIKCPCREDEDIEQIYDEDEYNIVLAGNDQAENISAGNEDTLVGPAATDQTEYISTDQTEYISAGREDDPRDSAISLIKKEIFKKIDVIIISERNKKIQITNADDVVLESQLKNLFPGKIQKIIQYPKIPGDERLKRFTYYYTPADKRYPLIDLFNISDYDPIPQKNGYAHPMVVLRIIIVDIWTLKLIKALGQIDEKFATFRINDLMSEFWKIKNTGPLNLDVYHNGYTYVGVMDADRYAKSKIIRKMRGQSEIYLPYNEHPNNKTEGGDEKLYTPASKTYVPANPAKPKTFLKCPSTCEITGGYCKITYNPNSNILGII